MRNTLLEGLSDIHTDFEFARRQWKKLGLGVNFDDAYNAYYDSTYDPEHWGEWQDPVYSEEAWDGLVNFANNMKQTEGEEEKMIGEGQNNAEKFVDYLSDAIEVEGLDLNIDSVNHDPIYGSEVKISQDYDDLTTTINFYNDGTVEVSYGDMGGVESTEEFESYDEFMANYADTLGESLDVQPVSEDDKFGAGVLHTFDLDKHKSDKVEEGAFIDKIKSLKDRVKELYRNNEHCQERIEDWLDIHYADDDDFWEADIDNLDDDDLMDLIDDIGYYDDDDFYDLEEALVESDWRTTPYGFSEKEYKGYIITNNGEGYASLPGGYDYSVDYCGDEVLFETEEEAMAFIDEISEEPNESLRRKKEKMLGESLRKPINEAPEGFDYDKLELDIKDDSVEVKLENIKNSIINAVQHSIDSHEDRIFKLADSATSACRKIIEPFSDSEFKMFKVIKDFKTKLAGSNSYWRIDRSNDLRPHMGYFGLRIHPTYINDDGTVKFAIDISMWVPNFKGKFNADESVVLRYIVFTQRTRSIKQWGETKDITLDKALQLYGKPKNQHYIDDLMKAVGSLDVDGALDSEIEYTYEKLDNILAGQGFKVPKNESLKEDLGYTEFAEKEFSQKIKISEDEIYDIMHNKGYTFSEIPGAIYILDKNSYGKKLGLYGDNGVLYTNDLSLFGLNESFDESISLGGGMKLPYDDNYCIFAKSADKKVTIIKINNKKEFQDAERRYGSFINVCSTAGAAKSYTKSFTGPAKEWPVEVLTEGALTEGSYSSDEFGDWVSDFELIPYEGYYGDEDYQIGIYNAGPHEGKYFIWDDINGSVLDNTYYDTEEEARKDLSWYLEESLTEGAMTNGSYSLYNGWVKVPDKDSIPDEYPDLEPEYSEWVERAESCETMKDIDNFIDDVYKLRQQGLLNSGEYGKENLIFKELRNNGYLQKLKDMKVQKQNQEMSLESLKESAGSVGLNNANELYNVLEENGMGPRLTKPKMYKDSYVVEYHIEDGWIVYRFYDNGTVTAERTDADGEEYPTEYYDTFDEFMYYEMENWSFFDGYDSYEEYKSSKANESLKEDLTKFKVTGSYRDTSKKGLNYKKFTKTISAKDKKSVESILKRQYDTDTIKIDSIEEV